MTFIREVLTELYSSRRLIYELARDDFKLRFAGSRLGAVWGFIQPLVTIFLYWFVFQVGFRSTDASGRIPYILWLTAGMIPWFFFQEAWSGTSNYLYEYSFLVKKVVFKIEILPFVKLLSALFVHLFFVALVLLMMALYEYKAEIYVLQLAYYLFSELILIYALSLIVSSLSVFIKDVLQVMGVMIQISFWMVPIVSSPDNLQGTFILKILRLNPVNYFIEGYRDALLNHVWFWEKPFYAVYYWAAVCVLLGMGIWVYRKLKRYFADLL